MGFMITRATEVSIRFLLHLSISPLGRVIPRSEIVKAQEVSPAFLTKISQPLIRAGLVKSRRGKKGGFVLARDPKSISLLDILTVAEGSPYINRCLMHRDYCPLQDSCPVHRVWSQTRQMLVDRFSKITLENFAQELLKDPNYLDLIQQRVAKSLLFRQPDKTT